jgi:predicted transcriptional regulator
MATKWNHLKHKASPEKREELKREALAVLERSGMGILRTTRHQTQVAVAEQMKIPQSAVSRIERQRDFRLSTLQRYVAALGGRLEVHAVFPDDTVDLNTLMEAPGAMQGAN